MLPKKHKLKSNSKITQVFKNGKTVKSSFLFLRYRANQSKKTKAAFSIGLKYSKKAVARNKAKRILREAMHQFTEQVSAGYDLVFYFDKNFKDEFSLKIAEENMKACLSQAKLLK